MKKIYFFLILVMSSLCYGSEVYDGDVCLVKEASCDQPIDLDGQSNNSCNELSSETTIPETNSIGTQLLMLLRKKNSLEFQMLLKQTAQQYKTNKEYFFSIINTRDKHDYNLLLRAAITGDVENLSVIFDVLQEVYVGDKHYIFDYLDTRDDSGVSALSLSEYNNNRNAVEIILMRTFKSLRNSRELFFKFLTAADENGYQALMIMAERADSYNLQMLVKIAAFVLGKDSGLFKQFINASNLSGYRVLDLTQTDNDSLFLLRYGAEKTIIKKDALKEKITSLADQLQKAIDAENFNLFENIINQTIDFIKEDSGALFDLFFLRDADGWNAIMHACAGNYYNYLTHMLDTMERYSGSDEQDLLQFLLSATDYVGQTAFHIAISRRQYKTALYLIETLLHCASDRIKVFYILNTPSTLNGFTPFFYAVYGKYEFDHEVFKFIKTFIEDLELFFGKDSRLFSLLINARDYSGQMPLAYASDKRVRLFLKDHSAIDQPMKHFKEIGSFDRLLLYNSEL